MEKSIQNLSDLTIFSKYAKYLPDENRRETWNEICDRVVSMHVRKFPELKTQIEDVFEYVRDKKVVMSMRSAQFSGKPIELNNSRMYNCSFLNIMQIKDFSEIMFMLLGGCGVGMSVQNAHISNLPNIRKPKRSKKFLVGDNIEGWADAVRALFKAYFQKGSLPLFDYSDIRPKGTILKTAGGKAPGPEPLRRCINKIESLLDAKTVGDKLSSIEVYDIVCHIADAVLSGGIRRSSIICLFDKNDDNMLNAKGNFKVDILNGGFHLNSQSKMYEGEVLYKRKAQFMVLSKKQFEIFSEEKTLPWYYFEPHRARANNSVVLERNNTTKDEFKDLWKIIKKSGAGEPGFLWTNNKDYGVNPCAEIALQSKQFCNLSEVNVSNIESEDDLMARVSAAVVIGTIQGSYTDFHYISDEWKENAERDALLGVSLTGIADNQNYKDYDWKKITAHAIEVNKSMAKKLGINPAIRVFTIKPSGTVSLSLGTSSGIHARYAKYYNRRIRYNKTEPIAKHLMENHPDMVEDEFGNDLNIVVSIPIKSPSGSTFRDEPALIFLDRVKYFLDNWIKPGHLSGDNSHNISCTVNLKPNEWREVGKWCWDNKNDYNAISVLPYDNGTYIQAPFEEIDKETFEKLSSQSKYLDLSKVLEFDDNTELRQEVACSGGACEI